MVGYKILFAEDIPEDMELAETELKRAGIRFESKRSETKQEFIELLYTFKPDVVISDYSMPNFNGMEALKLVQQHSPYTPVIIHTGSINEETAVKCMKAGAFDYVLKEKILRLPYALREAYERSVIIKKNEDSQKALQVSEEKYKALFNSIAQGVFYVDKTGDISTLNPAACSILFLDNNLRYSLEHLCREWHFTTENYAEFDINKCIVTLGNENEERVNNLTVKAYNNRYGISKWLSINIIPQFHLSDYQALIVIEDITERKIAEISLIKAKLKAEESDRLKSSFLANLSHEVRTPMNAILGFSELLSELKREDETESLYLQTIQENSTKLLGIITDIIDMSKIETEVITLHPGTFKLSSIENAIIQQYSSQINRKGLKLFVTGFGSDIIIQSDEQKIKKSILSLIDNAVKFTDAGEITVTCSVGENIMQVHVKDTGCGVPEGRDELIFKPFRQADESFSRKYGGTGLGLTITKAYIEALGGKIWFERHNPGIEFSFSIPVILEKIPEMAATLSSDEIPDFSHTRFLVVEDDPTNFAYISKLLSPTGVEILYAANGIEAIDITAKRDDIGLILMDIKMPVMNGYEATEIIRQTNKSIPIIATTAYAMSGDKDKCLEAGCNDYISKPLKKTELYNVIKLHLQDTTII